MRPAAEATAPAKGGRIGRRKASGTSPVKALILLPSGYSYTRGQDALAADTFHMQVGSRNPLQVMFPSWDITRTIFPIFSGRSAFTATARSPGRQFIRSLVLFASVEPGTMPWPRQSLVVGGINQRHCTGLGTDYRVSVASSLLLANILSNFLNLVVNCLIEDHFTEDNHELEEQH